MQVSKWGNSLAIRLPAAVVDVLGLKEGDDVEIRVAGERRIRDSAAQARQPGPAGAAAAVPRHAAAGLQVRPARSQRT